ncbi:hypothetical protein RCL1_003328 [Eukaryota sp. TZLM3-RCL]
MDITLRPSRWQSSYIEVCHENISKFKLTLLFGIFKRNCTFHTRIGFFSANPSSCTECLFTGLSLSNLCCNFVTSNSICELTRPTFSVGESVLIDFTCKNEVIFSLPHCAWSHNTAVSRDMKLALMSEFDHERWVISKI